jgi:hypothetical protein
VPEGVPEILSTGDVCAVLGLTYDKVRAARRAGRLVSEQPWGGWTNHTYTPQAVVEYATRARQVVNWAALTDSTDLTD